MENGKCQGVFEKNMQNGRHPGVGDAHARVTERWKAEGKFLWIFMGLTEWGDRFIWRAFHLICGRSAEKSRKYKIVYCRTKEKNGRNCSVMQSKS